jgi:16S rRNA C1402 N4-methylase RsmH
VINKYSISDLAKIFIEYAEFTPQKSKEIAHKIIESRKNFPITTTFDLKKILNQVGL